MKAQASPTASGDHLPWVNVVATVLLAAAAVATAWSSYQAARWNAEQTEAFSAANASRVEANRSAGLANSQTQVDIAVFIQWVDARVNGEPDLARFYEARFRPEFRPAFEAWIATHPFESSTAPPSPFAMSEYVVAARAQADQLELAADASSTEARDDVQHATDYVLAVVLFAVALFFAGISTRLGSPRTQAVVLIIGCVLFVAAVVWIATFPINVSI